MKTLGILLGVSLMVTQAALRAGAVEIVAHRGASADAPENTLAAFELAWKQGADSIEGDFHLTRDGKIITIHDETTKRTTGVDWEVARHTLAELRTLDAGSWKGPRFQGQKPPTLEEVLGTIPTGKRLRLEVKCGPEIVPELARTLEASSVRPEQVVIISFQKDVIAAVKERLPSYEAAWLTAFKQDKETGRWSPTPAEVVSTARRIKADAVSFGYNEAVDAASVKALRDAGLGFHIWTINDPADARRMIDLGVESITTDRPGALREELGL